MESTEFAVLSQLLSFLYTLEARLNRLSGIPGSLKPFQCYKVISFLAFLYKYEVCQNFNILLQYYRFVWHLFLNNLPYTQICLHFNICMLIKHQLLISMLDEEGYPGILQAVTV